MRRKRKAAAEAGDGTASSEQDGGRKKAGRGLAVPIACFAVGALLGPKVLGNDTAQAAPSSGAAASVEGDEEAVELGPVVVLDPVTVNLADGHLLKVGLALQLGADAEPAEDAGTDPTRGWAPALDVALRTLGNHTMVELVDPAGRDAAKAELVERLDEQSDGEILDVYFHQFVMM